MIDEVLYDIPIEYRDRFQEILAQDEIPVAKLRSDLQNYLTTVRQVATMVKMLDLSEAEVLAQTGMNLLDSVIDEESHALVQAAIRYFILEEDDEEITGVLGFDDDVQVMNAVARSLGRADLLITVRRHD